MVREGCQEDAVGEMGTADLKDGGNLPVGVVREELYIRGT